MKRIFLLLALGFQLLAPSSFATYQPTITVSSSALPTGAATEAAQTTANAALAVIQSSAASTDTKLSAQATAANQTITNTKLDTVAANALKLPTTTSETHLSATTAATGTNYTAFASQACLLLDVVNTTGTDIEVTRGGTGVAIRVPNNSARLFGAITNASQISVRRVDTSNTQVAVTAVAITP